MNNYKITMYRTVKEACVWAVEADTPEAALSLAREKIEYIDCDLWESFGWENEERYGVELCK
jgi:hypothetical protein